MTVVERKIVILLGATTAVPVGPVVSNIRSTKCICQGDIRVTRFNYLPELPLSLSEVPEIQSGRDVSYNS